MATRFYLHDSEASGSNLPTGKVANVTDQGDAGADRLVVRELLTTAPTGPAVDREWTDDCPESPTWQLAGIWATPELARQTLAAGQTFTYISAVAEEGSENGQMNAAVFAYLCRGGVRIATLSNASSSVLTPAVGGLERAGHEASPAWRAITATLDADIEVLAGDRVVVELWARLQDDPDADTLGYTFYEGAADNAKATWSGTWGDNEYRMWCRQAGDYFEVTIEVTSGDVVLTRGEMGVNYADPHADVSVGGSPHGTWNQETSPTYTISGLAAGTYTIRVTADQVDAVGFPPTELAIAGISWTGMESPWAGHWRKVRYAGSTTYTEGQAAADPAVYLEYTGTLSLRGDDAMATITKVDPVIAERLDTVTITGTGFVAEQGEGTVTVGGRALTDITWADTSISGKLAADTPYGCCDVVVTPSTGTAATMADALMCIDGAGATARDVDEVDLGMIDSVYLAGLAVGYGEDVISIKPSMEFHDFVPNDGNSPAKTWAIKKEVAVALTLSQLNATNLALALGGTADTAAGQVTITDSATVPEYELGVVTKTGVCYVFPRWQTKDLPGIELNPREHSKFPISGTAMRLADGTIGRVSGLPTAA